MDEAEGLNKYVHQKLITYYRTLYKEKNSLNNYSNCFYCF